MEICCNAYLPYIRVIRAIRCASASSASPGSIRQHQLQPVVLGMFMRADASNPR